MTELLDEEEFGRLFDRFEHTAFRLETRDRYFVDEEQEPLRRFVEGLPADDSWFMEFFDEVRAWTAEGKRIERVRVVTEPLGEYTSFSLDLARLNTAAGEDIRYLPREQATAAQVPDRDYWLFDSSTVVVLGFDSADRLVGLERVTDPAAVVQHCYWRDAAWHFAVPYDVYSSRSSAASRP